MQQQELLQLINTGHAPVVVDVRSQSEYQAGHVPFWTAFTSDKLNDVEKNRSLVLYCEHGPRAGVAKLAFKFSGLEDISYLAGHMSAWKKAALPMEK